MVTGLLQFAVISPNGDLETGQDLPTDPDERAMRLSHLVKGDLETISLPGDAGLIGWVNDNGHELKMDYNPHATKVLIALGAELGFPWVRGPLVLTGTTDGFDTVGVTNEQISRISRELDTGN